MLFMFDGQLGEMSDDVLHLSVRGTSLGATKVVEIADLVHEEVNDGDDDGNTNTVKENSLAGRSH